MGKRRAGTPWLRSISSSEKSVAKGMLQELQRRRLATLEDCRLAWEHQHDPLAVAVAVTKAELPEWLADALLIVLYAGGTKVTPVGRTELERWWDARGRDEVDSSRAWEVVRTLLHPEVPHTWESAYQIATYFMSRDRGDSNVGPAAMKKSYRLVRDRLKDRGRYYWAEKDFRERLTKARSRLSGLGRPDTETTP
jgi:hypothetical protein